MNLFKKFRLRIACIFILPCILIISSSVISNAKTLITGDEAKRIQKALEWSYWNSQGGVGNGKCMYVFARIGCGWCAKLVAEGSKIGKHIEIRWIFSTSSGDDTGFITTEPVEQSFLKAHSGVRRKNTPLQQAIMYYNNTIKFTFDTKITGVPTVFFMTKEGMVKMGFAKADEFIDQAKNIVPTQIKTSLAKPYLEKIMLFNFNAPSKGYPNHTKENIYMSLLPSDDAPVIRESHGFFLKPQYEYTVSWKYNDSWAVVGAFGKNDWRPFIRYKQ